MKHLFICSTPLQLMTAINIKSTLLTEDDAVLYILDHSHMYEEMYEKVSSSKLFTEVVLLKTKDFNNHWFQKYKITRYFVKAVEYLNYERIAKKIVNDMNMYDKFWVSFMDRSSWLMFLTYKKRNKNLELNFFEDGLGSYQLLTVQQNKLDEKLSHLLGLKSVFEEMQILYLYEPSLAINTLYPSVQIKALPKIRDIKIKNLLNEIFSFEFNDLELLKSKYIFFDSPFPSDELNKKQLEIIDFFIEKQEDSFCVKLHPRTLLKDEASRGHVSNVRTTIEMLCMNADVSNNVFIAVLSTVGITPKLMFDQEPVIIFLYKIIKLDKMKYIGRDFFNFIEELENTYTDPSRIYIPESMQELEEILDKLNSENSLRKT